MKHNINAWIRSTKEEPWDQVTASYTLTRGDWVRLLKREGLRYKYLRLSAPKEGGNHASNNG